MNASGRQPSTILNGMETYWPLLSEELVGRHIMVIDLVQSFVTYGTFKTHSFICNFSYKVELSPLQARLRGGHVDINVVLVPPVVLHTIRAAGVHDCSPYTGRHTAVVC